jgi:hypothetical protein
VRLSRQAKAKRAQIEEAFLFSSDNQGIAKYYRVPLYEVMALRQVFEEQLAEQQEQARAEEEIASTRLKCAIDRLFRNWEREHGFQKGAGELLLPAGYDPVKEAA